MSSTTGSHPLLCVDGPWLMYRSFYGVPSTVTGANNEPANALLGFLNTMIDLVRNRQPRAVVICFGDEAAEYRVESYSGYHAQRPPMPTELEVQWERISSLIQAFDWSVAYHAGFEADDLLHSYALNETEAGGNTLIFTADRDMFQCVNEHVHVLMPRRGSRSLDEVDIAEVNVRYGVSPESVPDFIALRGDPSDGLPGAKGIGAKTASDLLIRHGTLEGVIAGAIGERPGVRAALIGQSEQLLSFKEIATLRTLPVELPADATTTWLAGAQAVREQGLVGLANRIESFSA